MRSALLAVLTVGAVAGLLAWRNAVPPSVRWQYHTWSPGRNGEARLDSLGAEGWELVAVTNYEGVYTQMYFKRPLP